MEFWTSERRGAVEIATFSNPPRNYIGKPQLDELAQLVAQWRDPSIRAVVIQSRTGEAAPPDLGNGDRRQPVTQEIPPRPD